MGNMGLHQKFFYTRRKNYVKKMFAPKHNNISNIDMFVFQHNMLANQHHVFKTKIQTYWMTYVWHMFVKSMNVVKNMLDHMLEHHVAIFFLSFREYYFQRASLWQVLVKCYARSTIIYYYQYQTCGQGDKRISR